jgi:hypothetical protein
MKLLVTIPALLVIIIIACYPGKLGNADKRHLASHTSVSSALTDTTTIANRKLSHAY